MSLHWLNEENRESCSKCTRADQCNASFRLGVEEFLYDNKGKLQQIGERFNIDHCFQKEANEVMEYMNFFLNFKRFGMPYNKGWLEIPLRLFLILDILENESKFLRRKDG